MSSFRTSRTSTLGTTAARRGAVALAATAVVTAALASSVPAYAAGGQGGRAVRASNVCGTGSVKLKAKPDAGGILEVGTELNTDVTGQVWTLSLDDNGVAAWTGSATTAAPTGAVGVGASIPNLAGADVITLVATNTTEVPDATGATTPTSITTTCTVSVTL